MGALVPVLAAENCCVSTSVTSAADALADGLSSGDAARAASDMRDFLPEALLLPLHGT